MDTPTFIVLIILGIGVILSSLSGLGLSVTVEKLSKRVDKLEAKENK